MEMTFNQWISSLKKDQDKKYINDKKAYLKKHGKLIKENKEWVNTKIFGLA